MNSAHPPRPSAVGETSTPWGGYHCVASVVWQRSKSDCKRHDSAAEGRCTCHPCHGWLGRRLSWRGECWRNKLVTLAWRGACRVRARRLPGHVCRGRRPPGPAHNNGTTAASLAPPRAARRRGMTSERGEVCGSHAAAGTAWMQHPGTRAGARAATHHPGGAPTTNAAHGLVRGPTTTRRQH